MSMFTPLPKPAPKAPEPKRGERGIRGIRYSTTSVEEDLGRPKRRTRANKVVEKSRGFLLGDGTNVQNSRWYYDLDGRYVRVRGKKFVVELFGPNRALAALTEDERRLVMNARKNAYRAGKDGAPKTPGRKSKYDK